MKLEGKSIIVTGAGRGIGEATAKMFAAEGAKVCVAARSTEQIERVASEINSAGGRAIAVACDVTQPDQVEAMVAQAEAELGPTDMLVNNAGVAWGKPVGEITLDEWRALMAVNVDAVFLLTRKLLPLFHAQHSGQIVNICSDAGIRGIGGMTCYCASKFAVRGFTLALREELRGSGIRVNLVLPGPTNTTIIAKEASRTDLPQPEDIADVVWQVIALPPRADVWEVLVEPGPAS